MKFRMFARLIVLLPIVLFVAACSSSGKLAYDKPKQAPIDAGKNASLIVTSTQSENSVEMVQRLRSALFGRLVSEAIFKHVLHPKDKGDYSLKIEVLKADSVSQGARIFFGVLAGSNKLICSVQLLEQATVRLVTKFQVEGESASHPLSSENGKDDAIREVVSKIIVALQ